jgi:hypothetical protein
MPRLEHRIEHLEKLTATSEEVFPIPYGGDQVAYMTKRQVREMLDDIAEHGRWILPKPRGGVPANGTA